MAFHFPPLSGGSGVQRALRFVQHLPEFGWKPIVLTAAQYAYETTSAELMREIPPEAVVARAPAFDAARHLAIRGRYIGALARPDRWMSWSFGAIPLGMRLIRKYAPQAMWSTYPIATAHRIAAALQVRSGLPWIADFRDPMAQDGYPPDPETYRSFQAIEKMAFARAARCVFAAPGAARMYAQRFGSVSADKIIVIENGYDERTIAQVESSLTESEALRPGVITLLHSGMVYPVERDPTQLFAALARLRDNGTVSAADFRIRFRAPDHDDLLLSLANQFAVLDLIEVLPPVPYRDALAEMLRADGLLVLQAANCNDQIPAKLYEYFRAGRPIIGLTHPDGDTARAMIAADCDSIAQLENVDAIVPVLGEFIQRVRRGHARVPSQEAVRQASRRGRTQSLAEVLGGLTLNGRAA